MTDRHQQVVAAYKRHQAECPCSDRAAAGYCICLDAENALSYADVPNELRARSQMREVLQSINLVRS
jgi:hypothetical protein